MGGGEEMRKWNLPLTYAPKIPKVLSGECTQTIRAGRKFSVGDLVSFHGWEGKPYRSKWAFRTPYFLVQMAWPIIIQPGGIVSSGMMNWWRYSGLDELAKRDGIDPPTGKELGRVLRSYHKIPAEGLEAQIIRWEWTA
jgi:hypothetical protein